MASSDSSSTRRHSSRDRILLAYIVTNTIQAGNAHTIYTMSVLGWPLIRKWSPVLHSNSVNMLVYLTAEFQHLTFSTHTWV